MAETTYDLVFRAELLPEGDDATARATLGRMLKLDDARLRQLFSGGTVHVGRAVDRDTAVRYQAAFRQAGARLRVVPVEAAEVVAPRVLALDVNAALSSSDANQTRAPGSATDPAPSATEVDAVPRKPSLAERLAAQQPAQDADDTVRWSQPSGRAVPAAAGPSVPPLHTPGAAAAPDDGGLIDFVPMAADVMAGADAPPGVRASGAADRNAPASTSAGARSAPGAHALLQAAPSGSAHARHWEDEAIEFTLAPVGADLIDEEEREVKAEVLVNVEHIDLAPPGGVIPVLHPRAAIRPTVNIPDFDVAEAGALLAELTEFVELPLDLTGYSLAPAGANLGPAADIAPMDDVLIRLDHLKLAPAGSDLRGASSP